MHVITKHLLFRFLYLKEKEIKIDSFNSSWIEKASIYARYQPRIKFVISSRQVILDFQSF